MPSMPMRVTLSKKSAIFSGFEFVEEGAVDGDAEAHLLGLRDGGDGLLS